MLRLSLIATTRKLASKVGASNKLEPWSQNCLKTAMQPEKRTPKRAKKRRVSSQLLLEKKARQYGLAYFENPVDMLAGLEFQEPAP